MAARFLRLAFRINMEQVKLAGAEPAPLPEPLTEEELAEQEAQAEEERAEIAAVRERSNQNIEATQRSIMDELEVARYQAEQARRDAAAAREEAAAARQEADAARREADEARATGARGQESGAGRQEPGAGSEDTALVLHKMHNLHTEKSAESAVSACSSEVCIAPGTESGFAAPRVHGLPNRCLDHDSIVAATYHHDADGACADSSLPMLARTTAGP
jgi:hypothetical protein